MKHLYIETYGCQMNVADSEVVASVMRMAGYEPCDTLDEADAVGDHRQGALGCLGRVLLAQ